MSALKNIFPTMILVLLLVPSLFMTIQVPLVQGAEVTDGPPSDHVPQASGAPGALILDLDTDNGFEAIGYLSLPTDATVIGAAVTVIPGPGGPGPVHPEGLQVDVGSDGTPEWMFDGEGYGSVGRQTLFSDGTGEVFLGFPGDISDHSWLLLPRDAQVHTAHLLIIPFNEQDWWDRSWKKRVPITISAPSDRDQSPIRVEHEVDLGPNTRDMADELRLVLDDGGTADLHPFWVVASSHTKATIGFQVPAMKPGEELGFELYFDNPATDGPGPISYEPSPVQVHFANLDDVPAPVADVTTPLARPHGLHVTDSKVYVADTSNHRIVVMDHLGHVQGTFGMLGEPGNDASHFHCPHDVLVDGSGRMIVADTCNHRVQVLGPGGSQVHTIGTTSMVGTGPGHLFYPWSVALDDNGKLFISDMGNNRVQVFSDVEANDASWTIGETGASGKDSQHLDCPRGLAFSDDLFVVDAFNARVQVFDDHLDRWASRTLGLTNLGTPSDVALGSERTYIADGDADRVLVLDTDGHTKDTIEGLLWPQGVAVGPDGEVWISDTGNDRIIRLVQAELVIGPVEEAHLPKDTDLMLDDLTLLAIDGRSQDDTMVEGLEYLMMDALQDAECNVDNLGIEMCKLKVHVKDRSFPTGTGLIINGLDIRYSFSTRMYVALASGDTAPSWNGSIPVKASSRSGGRVVLDDIVLELDHPPFISGPAPTIPRVLEESPEIPLLDLDELFQDEDPGSLTYELALGTAPPGCKVQVREDGWLMLDLSGSRNRTGPLWLQVVATDRYGQRSAPLELEVPIEDIPDPPIIPTIAPIEAQCLEEMSLRLNWTDGDGEAVTFAVLDGPEGILIGPDGDLNWTPGPDQTGHHDVTVVIDDGSRATTSELVISVACPNSPPQVSVEERPIVLIGDRLDVQIEVTDRDGDEPVVELALAPPGMTLDPVLDRISWRPTMGQEGTHLVMVTVSDGIDEVDTLLRVLVQRPRPWVRLLSGPDKVDDRTLSFSGIANGIEGSIDRVEMRMDNGPWRSIAGSRSWTTEVGLTGLSPGLHRIEFRSYDGTYSDPVKAYLTVFPEGRAQELGAETAAPVGTVHGPVLAITILLVMIFIGGIIVLKRVNGEIFCVHSRPGGPTMCIPLGGGNVEAGGPDGSEEEEGEDVPEEVPREARCFICLGKIKRPEDHTECPRCGRTYHRACARRLKSCPMCSESLVADDS